MARAIKFSKVLMTEADRQIELYKRLFKWSVIVCIALLFLMLMGWLLVKESDVSVCTAKGYNLNYCHAI